jgi:integrase
LKGRRPLTDAEVARALAAFTGRHEARNRCLFVLGLLCGFRVSEMLALRVRDVVAAGRVRVMVTVPRRHMKGRQEGRSVFLPPEGQRAVLDQVRALEYPSPAEYLFRSQRGGRPICRAQAHRVLVDCFSACGIMDQVATHSLRKTFASKIYDYFLKRVAAGEPIDPFTETSLALGHRDPASTRHYLSFRDENRREAARAIGRALHA